MNSQKYGQTALTHLESRDSYVKLLFLDFSSAFNTIIPQTLANKLQMLGLTSSLCNWVLDFLTHRPQSVKIHGILSSTIILNTGSPKRCVLITWRQTIEKELRQHHQSCGTIEKIAKDRKKWREFVAALCASQRNGDN